MEYCVFSKVQRIVTNMAIARQGSVNTFPWKRLNAETQNNRGTVRHGDLHSVRSLAQLVEYLIWSRVPRDSNQRMTALARASSNCKRQTRPPKREFPTSTNPQLSGSNKVLVVSPRWVPYCKTDWPTDHRS
jgi:hypothetical protein